MTHHRLLLFLFCLGGFTASASAAPSIARVWNEQNLAAIRLDFANPPVQARNLFHVSVAMYDAWAAYDSIAVGYLYHGKATAADVAAARREAISYAAYRMLSERYALSRSATNTLATLDAQLAALGYDKNNTSTNPATPAGLGNLVAATVSSYFIQDGARQLQAYQDLTPAEGGYAPLNPPMATGTNGAGLVVGYDPNRGDYGANFWQPLAITNATDQFGNPIGPVQRFQGAQWLGVRAFALTRTDPGLPWINPGPPPRLGGTNDPQFRAEVVDLIQRSSQLTPDDGVMINISPTVYGNNGLGANDGAGHTNNPITGLPYPDNFVKRGDFVRVLTEYWSDGPTSETPPGHWNVIANYVSDQTNLVKRIGGVGLVVDDLEWDVKLYFTMNGATHDAACAAWSAKRYYDGGRPITWIRYMGGLGQTSVTNPTGTFPPYHPLGLPLISNLIEAVTPFTAQAGGRHAGLQAGTVAIRTWPGHPADPANQHSGVRWIQAGSWHPFMFPTFVTPPFPGYFSGHSTYSRSSAEALTAFTGSPFFPGGLGTYTAPSNSFLRNEQGPSQTVQLQWATYYDAADQAGQSRLYGGIHPLADDFTGRRAGSQCGQGAWALARQYFDGSVVSNSVVLALRALNPAQCELRYPTLRGFYYKIQSTPDLLLPFTDEPEGFVQATDTAAVRVESQPQPQKFYRVVRALTP